MYLQLQVFDISKQHIPHRLRRKLLRPDRVPWHTFFSFTSTSAGYNHTLNTQNNTIIYTQVLFGDDKFRN